MMFKLLLVAAFFAVCAAQSPSDFCMQCADRRNHKDHYADPTDCHGFFQCFYINETTAIGIKRPCPAGTFWHDAILQCMPEGDTPCQDPCMDDGTHSKGCYAGIGCRQFFVCANTASYGMCCPVGSQFNSATCSCDETATCTDACEQQGPQVQTTVAPAQQFNSTVCQDSFGAYLSTVPGEANAYIIIDQDGHGTGVQYCPEFVAFDHVSCRCNSESDAGNRPTPAPQRQAIFWGPFDSDLQDHSVLGLNTFAYNGAQQDSSESAIGGGSLAVNGGRVEIPGLKSHDLRNAASWCAFFKGSGVGGVLSNNKDNSASEFTVIIAQDNQKVTARVNFWHPIGSQTLNSADNLWTNGNWNHVCVSYDGNSLEMYQEGNQLAERQFMGGFLNVAHCPYVVGTDQLFGTFNGHIDEVLVTPFAMTAEERTAHFNGDRAYLASRGFF